MDQPSGASSYILGHADAEVRRLMLQARLYDDCTEHALREAGLEPGMRVLDVGCGPGDVSFVAARLVGPTGSVLGIDAAGEVIDVARNRAVEQGLTSVEFRENTIADLVLDEPVDAVIGRLILMHLPDPAAALRRLAGFVRPGGVIAFSENDVTSVRSVPEIPLFRSMTEAVADAFRAADLDPAYGLSVYTLFQDADLGVPHLTLGGPATGADDIDNLAYGIEVWRLLYPVAEAAGLVTDELADPDALLLRLREEVTARQAFVVWPQLITASVRRPARL